MSFMAGLLGMLGSAGVPDVGKGLFGDQIRQAQMAPAPVAREPVTSLLKVAKTTTPTTLEVSSAIDRVEAAMPSKGFLKEIAKAESRMGQDTNTYRNGYFGGPMQVDKIGFEDTQDVKSHPKLKAKFAKVEKDFGIKWEDAEWEDLTDPLHSAIAARLLLSNVPGAIPAEKTKRADYWKKHYNSELGAGTVKHYLDLN